MTQENEVMVMEPQGQVVVRDPMVSMIERVVMDNSIDIARLRELLDMKKEMDANAARVAMAQAFAAFKAETINIVKDRKNTHTNSMYATIDAINKAVDSLLGKHGLATWEETVGQTETTITVQAFISHQAGHERSNTLTLPLDIAGSSGKVNKTTVQGIGSSITYARRYAKLALLGLAPDEDTDGNRDTSSDKVTEFQAKTISDLMEKLAPHQVEIFKEKEGVDDPAQLPKNRFNAVLAKLKNTIADTPAASPAPVPDNAAESAAKLFLQEYVAACGACKSLADIDGITENEATQKKREALKKYPELDKQAKAAMLEAVKRSGGAA